MDYEDDDDNAWDNCDDDYNTDDDSSSTDKIKNDDMNLRVGDEDDDYDQDYDDDDDADDATIATTRDGFSMDVRTESIIHSRDLIIPFPLTVPPLPSAKEHDFNRLQCRID